MIWKDHTSYYKCCGLHAYLETRYILLLCDSQTSTIMSHYFRQVGSTKAFETIPAMYLIPLHIYENRVPTIGLFIDLTLTK